MLVGVSGVALALLAGGFALYAALTLTTDRALDQQALSTAQQVAALVDGDRLPSPIPAAGTQVVQVIDDQQRVVAGSLTADRLVPVLRPDELRTALAGGAVVVDGARLGLAGPLRARAVPAQAQDAGRPVAVIVAVPIGDVLAVRTALRTALLVAFPLVLAVMAAVAWRVIGRTLRPVEELRSRAEQIGAGRLGLSEHARGRAEERLPVPAAADEIRALAQTLNGMLDRLSRSRARQQAFVADAAHELRSPLTSMRTQLEVAQHLGEGGSLPADLLLEVARLSTLVEDLLLLARTDAQAPGPAHPEAVDVRVLLADVAAAYAHDDVSVILEPGAALLARADRSELRRVLVNLVSNAVRHARSRVRLAAAADGDDVEVSVVDDGPGIAPADRERVFQRFTRLDDARSRDAGGSGLGLAIVAELVERAGGTVTLAEAAGGGLSVVVRLPTARNESDATPSPHPIGRERAEPGRRPMAGAEQHPGGAEGDRPGTGESYSLE